jgi:hypothetical protein
LLPAVRKLAFFVAPNLAFYVVRLLAYCVEAVWNAANSGKNKMGSMAIDNSRDKIREIAGEGEEDLLAGLLQTSGVISPNARRRFSLHREQ